MLKRQLRSLVRSRTLLLMLLPAIALVVLFQYIPMYGILLAFKQFNFRLGIAGSPWVGFQNFDFFSNLANGCPSHVILCYITWLSWL